MKRRRRNWLRRLRRWFVRRFLTRRTLHPRGRPQVTRPGWWAKGSGDWSVIADTYEEAEHLLTKWMDEAEARDYGCPST